MKHFNCWQVFVAGLAMVAGAWVAQPFAVAAEIELRATCKCNAAIVRLKDVAEIHAADEAEADLLGDLELFPTPQDGRHRTLRARQLQDILALSGLDLSEHRLSGSSQVEVTSESRITPVGASRPAAISRLASRTACEAVRNAILAYLEDQVSPDEAWAVDVELDAAQVQRLIPAGDALTVTGGAEPWIGPQEFEPSYGAADHAESIAVVVEVSRLPAVVVWSISVPTATS